MFIPTFPIKNQPNVGKYTIHGSSGNKAPEVFPIPFGIKASSVPTASASLMDWTRTSLIQVGETLEQKIARFGGGEMG